jgi:hypothetical protein
MNLLAAAFDSRLRVLHCRAHKRPAARSIIEMIYKFAKYIEMIPPVFCLLADGARRDVKRIHDDS